MSRSAIVKYALKFSRLLMCRTNKQTKNVDRLRESQMPIGMCDISQRRLLQLSTLLMGSGTQQVWGGLQWAQAVNYNAPTACRLPGLQWQTEGSGDLPAQCSHQSTAPPVITQALIELIKT